MCIRDRSEGSERPSEPQQQQQQPSTSQQQPDMRTNLLTEILNFKKTQLKSVEKKDDDSEESVIEEIFEANITPPKEEARSHFSFDNIKADRISLLDKNERRGSSGILRRPSLGLEPLSPAAASADRLSVTFKMETEVHDVDHDEDDDVMVHEAEEDHDPVAIILGLSLIHI